MKANQTLFPARTMARVLGVSKAGFYAWSGRAPSARHMADGPLLARLQDVRAASRGVYGAPRVHAALRAQGERHRRNRVARLRRQAGLSGCRHRKGGPTTTRRNEKARPALDLVDRNFTASAPDQLWVADITYVPTLSGFRYLAVVLDVFSRRIIGWSMRNHLRTEVIIEASRRWWASADPKMAYITRIRPANIYISGLRQPLPRSGRATIDGIRR